MTLRPESLPKEAVRSSDFVCPSCQSPLHADDGFYFCPKESHRFPTAASGIADFILPHRRAMVESFLASYDRIRKEEGWNVHSEQEYRRLPGSNGRQKRIWRMRTRTYRDLVTWLRRDVRDDAKILDAGAGNCWLSLRLTENAFRVTALDISLSEDDGLLLPGRLLRGHVPFRRVRAEYSALPFDDESFDAAILNGSLHYAADPRGTISSIMRVVGKEGVLYIMDSPFFQSDQAGRAMTQEVRRQFELLYGIAVPMTGEGFLRFSLLKELRDDYHVRVLRSGYGLRWRLSRFLKSLYFPRELATFPMIAIHHRRDRRL